MSDEERKPYIEKAELAKKQLEAERDEYKKAVEEEMIEGGQILPAKKRDKRIPKSKTTCIDGNRSHFA